MKTRIIRHEKTTGLFIDIPSLLDSMDEFTRKEFVALLCEDEVFIESVLRSVAKAEKYERGYRHLESLAHFAKLQREETDPGSSRRASSTVGSRVRSRARDVSGIPARTRSPRVKTSTKLKALLFVGQHFGKGTSSPLERHLAEGMATILKARGSVLPVLDDGTVNERLIKFFVLRENLPATKRQMAAGLGNASHNAIYNVTSFKSQAKNYVHRPSPCGNCQKATWSLTPEAFEMAKKMNHKKV